MNTSTVAGTNKENAHMIFKNQEHEKFYREYLGKCIWIYMFRIVSKTIYYQY